MSDIRLIAIDLDGTLLDDRKQLSAATIDAIGRVSAGGVKIVLASARPPRSVRAFYQQLRLDTWQINYNGAMIWDEPRAAVIHHNPMDGGAVLRLIQRSRMLHAPLIVHCEILDRWHTDRHDLQYTTGTGRLFAPDVLSDMETICREPITTLNLLGNPADIDRIEPLLTAEFGREIDLVRAGDNDLLIGKHCSSCKSFALKQVAEHYDVPISQVMAIGDAMNDLPMLQSAAVSVAMGNAPNRVKQIATWIAPSNECNGVVAALQHFGLLIQE